MVEVFNDAEDLESLENLHSLCSLMQTIRAFSYLICRLKSSAQVMHL
jgi:hypothetical protein